LEKVNKITEHRNENASLLSKMLTDTEITLPFVPQNVKHAFHQYTIKWHNRDALHEHLHAAGIDSRIFYPQPLHCVHHFSFLGNKLWDFPNAVNASKFVLSIPVHPLVTEKQLKFIAETIKRWREDNVDKKIDRHFDSLRTEVENRNITGVLVQLGELKKDAEELEKAVGCKDIRPSEIPSLVIDEIIKKTSSKTSREELWENFNNIDYAISYLGSNRISPKAPEETPKKSRWKL
ncbi:MAG TPA: DegT/DnrJ/EryC1/StrS family aminotransferase, partial [Candidatus Nanoarchaeia archaeon]|nr:DegT/DnrJ/EryC1/StrS family aminotransferase [Candidatus Nanoarchaeia archaeon]